MKTKIHASLRVAAFAATLFLGASAASAQLLQSWQFNETAGTALNATLNSGPGSSVFASAIAGATTNGSGSLVISGNYAASVRSFAAIPSISSGIVQLDVNVSGWSFVGVNAATGPLLEFGLSAASTGNNAAIRTAHIYYDVDSTVGASLAGVAGGSGSSSTPIAQDQVFAPPGGLTRITPITFRLIANFDTLSYTVSHSDSAFAVLSSGNIATGKAANFVSVRALDDFSIGGTGGNFAIDSITLTAIPEPSSFASIAGLGVLGLVLSRRRRTRTT